MCNGTRSITANIVLYIVCRNASISNIVYVCRNASISFADVYVSLFITLANKKNLAYKVRAVLGCIGGAEFENDLIFFRLALVFEIF